jgi:anhydro-N-acetylmuramic acid kinase
MRAAKPMRVIGLMSGTSADGIDAAIVRISGAAPGLRLRLEGFLTIAYPPPVRAAVLRIANGGATSSAEISQLNFLVGEMFAQAALNTCRRFRLSPRRVDLIGSHGQTVYHQGQPSDFLGAAHVASTLQIGEPSVIAARTAITTVADFRPADMAAGGQGAPLVPFVDFLFYRDPRRGRVALNIGGIANVTAIPAGARPEQVFAFDTGPGNMVIDALVRHFTRGKKSFDRDARVARRGILLPELLADLLRDPYFRTPPPKTAGREQFGQVYTDRLIAWGQRNRARPEDLIRTATLLTPLSILDGLHHWVRPRMRVHQIIISGGGAHNSLVLAQLRAGLAGVEIIPSGQFGIPEDAKEAVAFAILAYETFHGRPANLPAATGAKQPAILGKIVPAPPRAVGRRPRGRTR